MGRGGGWGALEKEGEAVECGRGSGVGVVFVSLDVLCETGVYFGR